MNSQKASPKDEAVKPEANLDLGFGSVVTQESRVRFLNRDGTFNVSRIGLPIVSSVNFYHLLLTISWRKFLGIVAGLYLIINLCFALGYLLCGSGAISDTSTQPFQSEFWRAFFFSVETFATIGYGAIHPVGYPANFLVTLEAFFGLLAQALITGLLFARFSRPTAQIVFSETAVIAPYRDMTAFMFRLANQRSNQLFEVRAQVLFARFINENGKTVRRFDALNLERPSVSFMPLSWTIVHPIDENSPMFDLKDDDLRKADAEFIILLTANDETFAQTVHTRSSFKPDEIEWNSKFRDLYVRGEGIEKITIDIRKLSKTEKIEILNA
ncbi:MAG: ion channel [Pyrinomonadaceae bacterium]